MTSLKAEEAAILDRFMWTNILPTEKIHFKGSLNITGVWAKKVTLRRVVANTVDRSRRMNTEVLSLSAGLEEAVCLCCQHLHPTTTPEISVMGRCRRSGSLWATLLPCLCTGGLTASSSLEGLVAPEVVSVGLAEQQHCSEQSRAWPLQTHC